MDNETAAAEAVFSHCKNSTELAILAAWVELSLSEELPANTNLNLKFGKNWTQEDRSGQKVRDLVRVVLRDYGVPRDTLTRELKKITAPAQKSLQKTN